MKLFLVRTDKNFIDLVICYTREEPVTNYWDILAGRWSDRWFPVSIQTEQIQTAINQAMEKK